MFQTRSRRVTWVLVTATSLLAAGSARAAEAFDYFSNSWNVIGLKDYRSGTRITPDNQLALAGGARLQLAVGREPKPLGRQPVKRLCDGWLPIIELTADDGEVRYEFTLWATPLPTVKDWQAAFDWPTEGENFLNWIAVRATNRGKVAAEARCRAEQDGKSAPPASEWSAPLPPGGSAQHVFRVPFGPVADAAAFAQADPDLWLQRTKDYWRGLLAAGAQIEVPCVKATEALRAAHVCQLIANDHGQLHGGEGFYDEFYIRDGGYQIMELEEAGLHDAAAKAVAFYLKSQRPDGRFETQANQFDANGQAIWVLWQYYQITGDRAWLERAYPPMRAAAAWAQKTRRQAPADSPFAGLLPVAPADGEFLWDAKHHIVGYDVWNLRGMLCTAEAAAALGRADEARALQQEAEAYRKDIFAAARRTELPHFPPSWEKDGTHWGNTELLWPTELFPVDDARVAATIHHARKLQGGGFIEGTIQWLGARGAIHPYMSAYTTMNSLARGEDEQVVEDFYWYLLHSTAAHAFPEGIFYRRRFAWSDTIPHVTGASNYAILLRHMLVHERGRELHLLPAVPDGWLADGQTIRVERAPTHFGPINLTVQGRAAGIEVQWSAPQRAPPSRVVLRLPKSRPLLKPVPGVEVVLRPDQSRRWDFATVVKLYREQAPAVPPIAGLVSLPLGTPLPADRCRCLDLAPLTNTDPFAAPFGVPKPGKFLFTGLPTGEQTIAGVRFKILDPAANGGRGLIVLHSPRAPQDRKWPKEVVIPVGRAGKRLFFLGNVHGWDPQDPGAGPAGAVAEYVICYADGQQQVVPWISGRTTDDWVLPPEATDVHLGLKAPPWHLNVLGVALRDAAVEKIVFRDLDTPAAPLLAAVTLEE